MKLPSPQSFKEAMEEIKNRGQVILEKDDQVPLFIEDICIELVDLIFTRQTIQREFDTVLAEKSYIATFIIAFLAAQQKDAANAGMDELEMMFREKV